MVYFIFSPDDPRSLVKIGYTKGEAAARMEQLQTGNPFRLCLLLALEGGRAVEQQLHRRFRQSRDHGEWFHPTDDLRQFIRDALGEGFDRALVAMAEDAARMKWLADVLGWAEETVVEALNAVA